MIFNLFNKAKNIIFDKSNTKFNGTNVQAVIEEVDAHLTRANLVGNIDLPTNGNTTPTKAFVFTQDGYIAAKGGDNGTIFYIMSKDGSVSLTQTVDAGKHCIVSVRAGMKCYATGGSNASVRYFAFEK